MSTQTRIKTLRRKLGLLGSSLPPLIMFVNFVTKKNQDFFDEAEIDGETIRLLPGESQEEFRNRAADIAERTKKGPTSIILMSYSKDEVELERRLNAENSCELISASQESPAGDRYRGHP